MHKIRKVLKRLHLAKFLCNRLVGKEHKFHMRAIVGIAIMVVGVFIVKNFGHSPDILVAVAGDCVGLGLHGIGLIPFVELLLDIEEG